MAMILAAAEALLCANSLQLSVGSGPSGDSCSGAVALQKNLS